MASLKALKLRIGSVKSTQKITKALNMVAASKLRRAQQNATAGRPYSDRMRDVVASIASRVAVGPQSSKLLAGTGKDDTHLIVVCTSDRGLAGVFNSNIVRAVRREIGGASALLGAVVSLGAAGRGLDPGERGQGQGDRRTQGRGARPVRPDDSAQLAAQAP